MSILSFLSPRQDPPDANAPGGDRRGFARNAALTHVHNAEDVEPDAVRRETLNGDEWLVAPVVLVREAVLNGGFVPFEEIQRSAPGWNGRPVTVDHPTDANGEFTSANAPDVHEKTVVGHMFNVHTDRESRKLLGEMWIHVDRAESMGGGAAKVLEILDGGDVLEVSTGYFMRAENATGTHEGDRYDAVQRDILPDHLAALPNGKGACSVADGCGAPRTQAVVADGGDAIALATVATNQPDADAPDDGGEGDGTLDAAGLLDALAEGVAAAERAVFGEERTPDEWDSLDVAGKRAALFARIDAILAELGEPPEDDPENVPADAPGGTGNALPHVPDGGAGPVSVGADVDVPLVALADAGERPDGPTSRMADLLAEYEAETQTAVDASPETNCGCGCSHAEGANADAKDARTSRKPRVGVNYFGLSGDRAGADVMGSKFDGDVPLVVLAEPDDDAEGDA